MDDSIQQYRPAAPGPVLSRPVGRHPAPDPERLWAGERCVCELTAALGAGQSRLSFHLKTLKEAGLVRDRRDGRWMYYSVNPEAVAEVGDLLGRVAVRPQHQLPVLA